MNTNTKTTKNRMWTQVLQKDVNSSAPEVCELKCSWRMWTQVIRKDVNSRDPEVCELKCSWSVWTQVLRKGMTSSAPEVCELKCCWRVWTQVLRKGVNSNAPEGCDSSAPEGLAVVHFFYQYRVRRSMSMPMYACIHCLFFSVKS